MARYKLRSVECTVADAISNAIGELQGLAEEIREVVDNAEGGLAQTERIQTLDNTASSLEEISEPEILEDIKDLKVAYSENTGRLSRRARCDNAITALDVAIQTVQEEADKLEEGDKKEEYEGLVNELEDIKGNAEGCEFPGMYG